MMRTRAADDGDAGHGRATDWQALLHAMCIALHDNWDVLLLLTVPDGTFFALESFSYLLRERVEMEVFDTC
jgi:hypothetical protein